MLETGNLLRRPSAGPRMHGLLSKLPFGLVSVRRKERGSPFTRRHSTPLLHAWYVTAWDESGRAVSVSRLITCSYKMMALLLRLVVWYLLGTCGTLHHARSLPAVCALRPAVGAALRTCSQATSCWRPCTRNVDAVSRGKWVVDHFSMAPGGVPSAWRACPSG